jgi:hypothetical protein
VPQIRVNLRNDNETPAKINATYGNKQFTTLSLTFSSFLALLTGNLDCGGSISEVPEKGK